MPEEFNRNERRLNVNIPFVRENHPYPLKADYFEGDQMKDGMKLLTAPMTLFAENHVSKSKAILAGTMDKIPDVGVGGRSDGQGCVGVYGYSENGTGVHCKSKQYEALHAETNSTEAAAIAAYQMNPESKSAALYAKHHGNGAAAVFDGNVFVSGDIILQNADFAEDFDISDKEISEPGTVMVFGEDGALVPSKKAYDKCVAGVLSGAGSYKPGIILDKQTESVKTRKAIGLLGKVFCKVDANYGAIQIGDLLTTSPTSGHAMKAENIEKGFGSIIGKALKPLDNGVGMIPILIALQ